MPTKTSPIKAKSPQPSGLRKPAEKNSSIHEALFEYLQKGVSFSSSGPHDLELVRIAESLTRSNATRNAKKKGLTAEARRKGGKNRWQAIVSDPLLAQIVQQCEKKAISGTSERDINGYLCEKFCGVGKPGEGKYSRERIRRITRMVLNWYASQTKKTAS